MSAMLWFFLHGFAGAAAVGDPDPVLAGDPQAQRIPGQLHDVLHAHAHRGLQQVIGVAVVFAADARPRLPHAAALGRAVEMDAQSVRRLVDAALRRRPVDAGRALVLVVAHDQAAAVRVAAEPPAGFAVDDGVVHGGAPCRQQDPIPGRRWPATPGPAATAGP